MTENYPNYYQNIEKVVSLALEEDIGSGDITAELIPEAQKSEATVITRESAVVCGRPWFDEVFRQLDADISIEWLVGEGQRVEPNDMLVKLSGNSRSLLTGERAALNFLQTLMGVATKACEFAKLVEGTAIKVLDTRKTLPGLRLAQKYAVKVGGCDNHRIGLYDAYLIKENHIAACGSIQNAVERAKELEPEKKIEVETESLDELQQALDSGADIVMLDNFNEAMLEKAIQLKTENVKYEISGNLDLENIKALKGKAIDYVSSGALTKHCKAIDLSMRIG